MLEKLRITSLLLSLFVLLGVFSASVTTYAETEKRSDFVPVFRFIASSDTHITEDDEVKVERIRKMTEAAYEIADSDKNYKGVDALLVVGDLTDNGTKPEFDKFYSIVNGSLREETRFLGVLPKNHDGYNLSRSEMREYYKSLTGNDADFNVVIGGYHFIGVSASENKHKRYDSGQLEWLKKQLDEAVAEDSNKPVFLMHHEPVRGTVYGSSLFDGWGITDFSSLLKDYPQVVDFSGHSHYPVNDPRSVWQGEYTVINTGAIAYAEFTVAELRAYHPADSNDVANCWIVEADVENNIRLRGIDVNTKACLCDYVLKNPAEVSNREFKPDKMKEKSKAPSFADGAEPEAVADNGSITVRVPAAKSEDGMPVILYRATAKSKSGVTADKSWTLPEYYVAAQQKTVELELTGLAAGEYKVSVVAENAYKMSSRPIETTVTVDGDNTFVNFFKQIPQKFSEIKEFFVHLFW